MYNSVDYSVWYTNSMRFFSKWLWFEFILTSFSKFPMVLLFGPTKQCQYRQRLSIIIGRNVQTEGIYLTVLYKQNKNIIENCGISRFIFLLRTDEMSLFKWFRR